MSESHGTALILKRHEDFEKVATYVKQQVREKSLELRGEDLSEDDKYVGLRIKGEENEIIWHDYGHHGEHLDFNPIAESVIKEFPDVEMECQGWRGQEVWNYIIVDGKWQKYTLWKFVAYAKGKGEEVLLDYKEMTDGMTEEEKLEKRYKMCKELAEQHSRKLAGVEIAVYAYKHYDIFTTIEEFYRAKDGCASHEYVDRGIVTIMPYIYDDTIDLIESYGQLLLYPMECAAEIIKRARKDDAWYPFYAADMMLYGDTSSYFSLIEPSDKDWLMEVAEADNDDARAIYCLLFGMHHKFRYWDETFVDDDTKEEITIRRCEAIDGSVFEMEEGEEERLIQKVLDPIMISHLSVQELTKLCDEIDDRQKLLMERIRKGDEEAAYWIEDPAILQELCDKGNKCAAEQMAYKYAYGDEEHGIYIDHKKAAEYMKMAGEDYDPKDYQEAPAPHEFGYTLRGNASTLNGIETMILSLCQRFGTPDNELGMFVPLGALMKMLVGARYYKGNVISMNLESLDCLTFHIEANSGYPLLYALREAFPNLTVEMKETE